METVSTRTIFRFAGILVMHCLLAGCVHDLFTRKGSALPPAAQASGAPDVTGEKPVGGGTETTGSGASPQPISPLSGRDGSLVLPAAAEAISLDNPSRSPGSSPASLPVKSADGARQRASGASPDRSYGDALLTEDVAWRGEIHIAGSVTISPQTTLTIEPGTVIRCGGDGGNAGQRPMLLVHGRMVVKGTLERPVLFTSQFVRPMAGDWQGIILVGSEKKNSIEHCRVEGAETGLDASYATIALKNVHFSRCGTGARLRDTVVSMGGGGANGCLVGLYLLDAEADLHDAAISGNRQGVLAERSSLSISGGLFSRNDLDALKMDETRVRVTGGSYQANGTGITVLSSQGSLSGMKVSENADYGIRLVNSRVKVYGNEISRNAGAGLKVEDGRGVAWGNAIFENGGYDLVNTGTEEMKAMGNWWGGVAPSEIEKRISGRQDGSARGRVFFLPVLDRNPLAHK